MPHFQMVCSLEISQCGFHILDMPTRWQHCTVTSVYVHLFQSYARLYMQVYDKSFHMTLTLNAVRQGRISMTYVFNIYLAIYTRFEACKSFTFLVIEVQRFSYTMTLTSAYRGQGHQLVINVI